MMGGTSAFLKHLEGVWEDLVISSSSGSRLILNKDRDALNDLASKISRASVLVHGEAAEAVEFFVQLVRWFAQLERGLVMGLE